MIALEVFQSQTPLYRATGRMREQEGEKGQPVMHRNAFPCVGSSPACRGERVTWREGMMR